MDLLGIARWLATIGAILLVSAGLLYLAAKLSLPVGNLPGDLEFKRGNFTCILPLATSLLISIFLTIGLNLLVRLFRK
jgi:hypothetical protein